MRAEGKGSDAPRRQRAKSVASILKRIGRVASTPAPVLSGVSSPESFELELTKERARSDRAGHPFTVASFDWPFDGMSRDDSAVWAVLAKVLVERTRLTDTVGWLKGHLAVILPHTTAEEAARVCDAVTELFRAEIGPENAPTLRRHIHYYGEADLPTNGRARKSAQKAADGILIENVKIEAGQANGSHSVEQRTTHGQAQRNERSGKKRT